MVLGGGCRKEEALERYVPPKASSPTLGTGLTELLDTHAQSPLQHSVTPIPSLPDKELSVLEKIRDEGSTAGIWWLTGVSTYLVLYILGRTFLYDQAALEGLRQSVPAQVYDRSTFIFITAFCLDVLNMIFERHTTKIDFVLYPAFIKGIASTTNLLSRFGTPVVAFSTTGRFVMVQRYICWMHTTPTILLVVRLISTNLSVHEATVAVLWDELMLVSGVLALLTTGWYQVFWAIVTHVAFLPIIPYFCKGFYEAATSLKSGSARGMMWVILGVNMVTWTMFAVTWNLSLFNLISIKEEEAMYLICDFTAKVMFSSTLMLSSFKGMEARRERAMRNIEDSSKQKLIEELKRLLEQKERFMSSVSHELRTPLNGIIGISEGMLSGCCGVMPEQVHHQIHIIRTSGARLLALINDVMDAAALRQNKLVLKQEVVVLRHVVDDVLELTRSLVNTKQVELRNTVSPRITVLGDPGRVVQILNNLLSNAAKFTKRGSIKVSAHTFDNHKRVAVMVQDTGMGIPKGRLATIFLPFEQADMRISRKFGGFGLGLNIVQDLVKAHGGEIWAESIEGMGSTFTFTMVAAQSKSSTLYGSSSASQGRDSAFEMHKSAVERQAKVKGDLVRLKGMLHETSSPTESTVPSVDMDSNSEAAFSRPKPSHGVTEGCNSDDDTWNHEGSSSAAQSEIAKQPCVFHHQYCGRYQVMSVDDDPINQNVVCSIFNSSGFEVLPFSGGAEALHHLATCMVLPDLVLLDCMMPVMDGFEVLKRLRAMSQSMHLPVIMVSARAEEENIVMGLDSGADDYVTKPIRRAELLARARCQLGSDTASDDRGPTSRSVTGTSESMTSGAASSPASRGLSSQNRTCEVSVVCVDDDEVAQLLVQQLLEPEGWRHIGLKTSKEALQFFRAHRRQLPDLVLLDASLPDASGFDVCRELREHFNKHQLPIIIVSAYHNEESIVEGLNAGANDYVSKPFKRLEFMARMRMHLRHHAPGSGNSKSFHDRQEGPSGGREVSPLAGRRRGQPKDGQQGDAGLTAAAVASHTRSTSASAFAAPSMQCPATTSTHTHSHSSSRSAHAWHQHASSLTHPSQDPTSEHSQPQQASIHPILPTQPTPPQTDKADAATSPRPSPPPLLSDTPTLAHTSPIFSSQPLAAIPPAMPTTVPSEAPSNGTLPLTSAPSATLAGVGTTPLQDTLLASADRGSAGMGSTRTSPAMAPTQQLPLQPHLMATTSALYAPVQPPQAVYEGGLGVQNQMQGGWSYEPHTAQSSSDPGVQATWSCAGVLVASVHRWEDFSYSVPERELRAVMQTLVTTFGQMAESVGLVVLEATGRTFSAATLHQHTHTQLNPLSAVVLLQLAQGLMDAAAEVHLPPAYQPLPLQLTLHCGPVTTTKGAVSGEALSAAYKLLCSTPPLNIAASTSMVERLTAAGMSHPLHALPTQLEELLWVVEVHAAAGQAAASFGPVSPSAAQPELHRNWSIPAVHAQQQQQQQPQQWQQPYSNGSNGTGMAGQITSGQTTNPRISQSSGSGTSNHNGALQASIGSCIPGSHPTSSTLYEQPPHGYLQSSSSSSLIPSTLAALNSPLAGPRSPRNAHPPHHQPLAGGSASVSPAHTSLLQHMHTAGSTRSAPDASPPGMQPCTSQSVSDTLLPPTQTANRPSLSMPNPLLPHHPPTRPVFAHGLQPPHLAFMRGGRSSMSAVPINAAGGSPMPHPFRASFDMQRASHAGLAGKVHPFRGSTEIPCAPIGSAPPSVSPNVGTPKTSSPQLTPLNVAALNGNGQPQGLSAEQQLMVLRGEINMMRQQMDHLNSGEGRSVETTSTNLSPSSSRAHLASLVAGEAHSSGPQSTGGGTAKQAGNTATQSSAPSVSQASTTKKEKGSVSRLFSKMAHSGSKSKK